MRIAYTSDIHLEWKSDIQGLLNQFKNINNINVLVLAGDIIPVHRLNSYERVNNELFMEFINKEFQSTILIMGNHEHYEGNYAQTKPLLMEFISNYPNITLLDKSSIQINDVKFHGATLFTNYDNNPLARLAANSRMNDFRYITNNQMQLTPSDYVNEYHRSVDFLMNSVLNSTTKKNVIITHHAPSLKSITEHDNLLDYSYASNMDEIVMKLSKQVPYWIHGHIHHPIDYYIQDTNITSNPYGYKPNQSFNLKYFDV